MKKHLPKLVDVLRNIRVSSARSMIDEKVGVRRGWEGKEAGGREGPKNIRSFAVGERQIVKGNVVKEGWLWKKSRSLRADWKRRWVVLIDIQEIQRTQKNHF